MNNGTTRKKVNKIIFHQFNVVHSKNNKTNCIEKVTSAHSPLFENKNNFIIFRYMKPFHGVAYAEAFFFFDKPYINSLLSLIQRSHSRGDTTEKKTIYEKPINFFCPCLNCDIAREVNPFADSKEGPSEETCLPTRV